MSGAEKHERALLAFDSAEKRGSDDRVDSMALAVRSLVDGKSHSAESISATIAALQSLAETLPDITQMAAGAPYTTGALKRAVDMLGAFRARVFNEEKAQESIRKVDEQHALMRALERVREEGRMNGIEREKARAKEARKGRKNAPAKGAK